MDEKSYVLEFRDADDAFVLELKSLLQQVEGEAPSGQRFLWTLKVQFTQRTPDDEPTAIAGMEAAVEHALPWLAKEVTDLARRERRGAFINLFEDKIRAVSIHRRLVTIKTCARCDLSFDRAAWAALPLVGVQRLDHADGVDLFELRNCPCSSTLSRPLEKRDEALFDLLAFVEEKRLDLVAGRTKP